MIKYTTIAIDYDVHETLNKLKAHPRESFNDVIRRVLIKRLKELEI